MGGGGRSLTVIAPPNKTYYTEGDNLDISDIRLGVKDDNEVSEINNSLIKFKPENGIILDRNSNKTIIVSFGDDYDKLELPILVTIRHPVEAIIVKQPKTQYYVGDKLDLSGMVVGIKFNDNSVKTIDEYSCSIPSDTVLEASHNKAVITINYKEQQYNIDLHFSVREKPFINTLKNATPEEIKKMIDAANNGQINLKDYWKVGDRFTIRANDKSKVPYGWYQEIDFQIEDMDGELFGVRYHAAIGMRNVVNIRVSESSQSQQHSTSSNNVSSKGLNEFMKILPESLVNIMKPIKTYYEYYFNDGWSSNRYIQSQTGKMVNYTRIQITGTFPNSNQVDEKWINDNFGPTNARKARQFEYFKTSSNKTKYYINNTAIKYSLSDYSVNTNSYGGFVSHHHAHDLVGNNGSGVYNSEKTYGDSYFFVI